MPPEKDKKPSDDGELKFFDPFVGGEEDDLSDMEYVQDEDSTTKIETHPPETKAEREELEEFEKAEELEEEPEAKADDEKAEEEEPEEEPEAKAEAEEEPEEEPVLEEEEARIPKARFDEVNERMKKAEGRVNQLEEQITKLMDDKQAEPEPEADPYDFDAKEAEAANALLEGETEKYAQIRREIREEEEKLYMKKAQDLASQGDNLTREELAFDEAGAQLERDFPEFVKGHKEFNQDAYDELMDLYVGYAKSGRYNRAEALLKAGEKAARLYGLDNKELEPEPDPNKVVDIKRADPKKKAKDASKQPPVLDSTADEKNEPTIDVGKMSDEEFESLPESAKRRLRGDVL